MGKIYCTECGVELDDTVKFCSKCGSEVTNSSNNNISKGNLKYDKIGYFILSLVISVILWVVLEAHYDFYKIYAVVLIGSFIGGFLIKESIKFSIVEGMLISGLFIALLLCIVQPITFPFDLVIFSIILGGIGAPLGSFLREKVNIK